MRDILANLLLQEEVLEIKHELAISSSFNASRGWFMKFKNRHNVRLVIKAAKDSNELYVRGWGFMLGNC